MLHLLLSVNVLLIVMDDAGSVQRWPLANMPNVTQFMAEGTTFTQMYGAASCTPTRSSLLLGVHHLATGPGMQLNGTLNPEQPSYQDVMAEAGYYTGYGGKCWSPGDPLAGGRETNPCGPKRPDLQHAIGSARGQKWSFIYSRPEPHRPYNQHDFTLPVPSLPSWYPQTGNVERDGQDFAKAMISADEKIGDMLGVLVTKGIENETLVCILADNGWPFPGGKADTRLEGSHVGAVCRLPGVIPAGVTRTDFATVYDLTVGLLSVAQVEPPATYQGVDLFPGETGRTGVLLAKERHCDGRPNLEGYPSRGYFDGRYHLIHNLQSGRSPMGDAVSPAEAVCVPKFSDVDNGPTKTEIIKKAQGAYVYPEAVSIAFGLRPEYELYDTLNDPEELTNLYGTLPCVEADLSARMAAELASVGDPGPVFDAYPWYE